MRNIILSLALLASATTAGAVTYTTSPGAPDPVSPTDTVLVSFDTTTLPIGYTLTGGYAYSTTTNSTTAAAPAGDTTQYLYVSSALSPNNATLTTAFDLSKISFYWGSIDKYNTVDVLGAGGTSIFTLTGAQIPPSNGDQTGASTNQRVTFTADAGQVITGLKFTSTGIAFEVDTITGVLSDDGSASPAVPEPASWALFIVGFGMVGAVSRRRRSTTSFAA